MIRFSLVLKVVVAEMNYIYVNQGPTAYPERLTQVKVVVDKIGEDRGEVPGEINFQRVLPTV